MVPNERAKDPQISLPLGPKTATTPSRRKTTLSVSEAVERAGRCIDEGIPASWIEGELSGLKLPSSGHAYFVLRDERSALPVAMWRSSVQRLRFRLEDGQRLRIYGKLGIYSAQGKFQCYAEKAEPAGLGAMMLQLEQLKAKLAGEGLFSSSRKRSLPAWPKRIGVVTSPSGAAVHDIIKVIARRCPSQILISPAQVQGAQAPQDLCRALTQLQKVSGIDVIIIGRGGGSIEDLWAFNDEALARCIAASSVPVVSAVGHEVDFSVSDLVADVRAATPSQAAELVVPDIRTLLERADSLLGRLTLACERCVLDTRGNLEHWQVRLERAGRMIFGEQAELLDGLRTRLRKATNHLTRESRQRLNIAERKLASLDPRSQIAGHRVSMGRLESSLVSAMKAVLQRQKIRLAKLVSTLDALSPLSVLERGYSVVTNAKEDLVQSCEQVSLGEKVQIRLALGHMEAQVVAKSSGESR